MVTDSGVTQSSVDERLSAAPRYPWIPGNTATLTPAPATSEAEGGGGEDIFQCYSEYFSNQFRALCTGTQKMTSIIYTFISNECSAIIFV